MENFRNLELIPTKSPYTYKREERKAQPMKVFENERQLFDGKQFETWEEFVAAVKDYNGYGFGLVEKDGHQLWPSDEDQWSFWEYEQFGSQYPRGYYVWRDDKTAWLINPEYQLLYTGEWEVVDEQSGTIGTIESMRYKDYDDANTYSHENFYLTQTLFNNDAHFEYIEPVYDESSEMVTEYDRDGIGSTDGRETTVGEEIIAYRVISDNGTTVMTFTAEPGCRFTSNTIYCIRMGGQHYMVFRQRQDDTDKWSYAYFRIDKETSSITRVASMPMRVNPTIASHSDNITVELGNSSNAKEIDVINAAGQVVKRIPVRQGERSVTFSAQGITQGVNMVRAAGEKSQVTKIIIK